MLQKVEKSRWYDNPNKVKKVALGVASVALVGMALAAITEYTYKKTHGLIREDHG
jgi:hypothetical protein